ncbi:MAG: tRNA (N(6)-L-threonylcarbamoyladenosine(37)-C(2))-methylthiotransferase MtaB [Bacteroidetes bacterium GWA2_30_7]|nr:MAG: tRNA (N(6)-L-threonylcarbamoyladenosine(37)-C(2))-methylthiotransferase MtaB [Bacteroidetes bacterium GWA2_30_7]
MKKRIAFHTVGCKLNFSETSAISKLFNEKEFEIVDFKDDADFYVLNTCTVTKNAEKKCRQILSKVHNQRQDAKIIAVGCYSQLKPEDFKQIEGVSLVLGSEDKFKINDYLEQIETSEIQINECSGLTKDFHSAYSIGDRTRTFLKIQDGCDYFCSYCTIPLARGRSRNAHSEEIVKQVKEIAQKGSKEIILTGVNVGDFGRSTNEKLIDLLKKLDEVEGIERFRISSIEPNLITDEIIKFISVSEKFMPHFHIPLQSGNNKILQLMKRRYDLDLFTERVRVIKSLIPEASIGIDVILGFPSESISDFESTFNFIENIDISYLHAFPYSERENTNALKIADSVPQSERYRRCNEIISMGEKKKKSFIQKSLGNELNVLYEANNSKNKLHGYTSNYIRVETQYNKDVINKVVKVKLLEILENGNVLANFVN